MHASLSHPPLVHWACTSRRVRWINIGLDTILSALDVKRLKAIRSTDRRNEPIYVAYRVTRIYFLSSYLKALYMFPIQYNSRDPW